MPTILAGDFSPPSGRFALVAARFNHFVVEHLVNGALDGLKRHGVGDDGIDLIWVPGSYEIPFVAQRLASSRKYASIICLGAIIRGDTDHYDHVAGQAAAGIARAALETGVPVIFGVLTCDTLEQAKWLADNGNTGDSPQKDYAKMYISQHPDHNPNISPGPTTAHTGGGPPPPQPHGAVKVIPVDPEAEKRQSSGGNTSGGTNWPQRTVRLNKPAINYPP